MTIELIASIIAFILSIVGLILSNQMWLTIVSAVFLIVSVTNLSKLAYKEYQRRQTTEYIMRTRFPTFKSEGAEKTEGVGMPPSRVETKALLSDVDTLLANIEADDAETARELAELDNLLKNMRT